MNHSRVPNPSCFPPAGLLLPILLLLLPLPQGRAHPSSGIVVDKNGAVIFADEARNQVFRIGSDGRLVEWISGKHCHELFLDEDGALYGEHLEFIPDTSAWRSSIWKRDALGVVWREMEPSWCWQR